MFNLNPISIKYYISNSTKLALGICSLIMSVVFQSFAIFVFLCFCVFVFLCFCVFVFSKTPVDRVIINKCSKCSIEICQSLSFYTDTNREPFSGNLLFKQNRLDICRYSLDSYVNTQSLVSTTKPFFKFYIEFEQCRSQSAKMKDVPLAAFQWNFHVFCVLTFRAMNPFVYIKEIQFLTHLKSRIEYSFSAFFP